MTLFVAGIVLLSLLAAAIAAELPIVASNESKEGEVDALESQFPGMMPGMMGPGMMGPGMMGPGMMGPGMMGPGMMGPGMMGPGMMGPGMMGPGMMGPSGANGNCGCQPICTPW
jgi:hypothetical protein